MPQLLEAGGEIIEMPRVMTNDELEVEMLASWDEYDEEDNDIEDDDIEDDEDNPFEKEPSDKDIFDNDVPFDNPEDDLLDDDDDETLYN